LVIDSDLGIFPKDKEGPLLKGTSSGKKQGMGIWFCAVETWMGKDCHYQDGWGMLHAIWPF